MPAMNPRERVVVLECRVAAALRKWFDPSKIHDAGNQNVWEHGRARCEPEVQRIQFAQNVWNELDMYAVRPGSQLVGESWAEYMRLAQRQKIPLGGPIIAITGQRQILLLQCRLRTAVTIGYEIAEEDIARTEVVIDASRKLIQTAFPWSRACKPIAQIRGGLSRQPPFHYPDLWQPTRLPAP